MKILVIARGVPTKEYPLIGIFEYDQAKALSAQGHEVIYAVVDLRSIRRKRKLGVQHYRQAGMDVFSVAVPIGAVSTAIKDPLGKKALGKLYNNIEDEVGRPDIVHAHFLDMAVLAADLCVKEKLPLVVTEHSSAVNSDLLPDATLKRAKYAYSNAKQVIAVSSVLARRIEKHTGIKVMVVPNIVNMPEVKRFSNFKNDEFHFISAGSLVQGKGFDVLIKAFAEAQKKRPKIYLTIMGGGPEESSLQTLANELGLEKKVSFFGPYTREQFANELIHSDAFVLPSRGETFGVVYIEAMACGLPVIATRCGGPEDIVDDSNGILVDVDDVEKLSKAMLNLFDSISTYKNKEIAEITRIRFSAKNIGFKLTEIFDGVLRSQYE